MFQTSSGCDSSATGTVSCSSGMWVSLLGHQIQRPMSRVSAVTRTERTTRVSSRTPNATAKPISANADQRQAAERRERAGQHDAGRGDHAAGRGQAGQRAAAGAVLLRLLADPGHQEDVVVDAERDQEDEHVERERRVLAAEVEHVPEDQGADPERGPERQHHGRHQHQRGHDRAQQQAQDDQHDEQHQRDDQPVVVLVGRVDVDDHRGHAADLGVRAGQRVHRRPHLLDRVLRGLAVRRAPAACRRAGPGRS